MLQSQSMLSCTLQNAILVNPLKVHLYSKLLPESTNFSLLSPSHDFMLEKSLLQLHSFPFRVGPLCWHCIMNKISVRWLDPKRTGLNKITKTGHIEPLSLTAGHVTTCSLINVVLWIYHNKPTQHGYNTGPVTATKILFSGLWSSTNVRFFSLIVVVDSL